jgi:NAD(P)-dependent dehydrogenase (short-subunit alcohol dehydrogenase family)
VDLKFSRIKLRRHASRAVAQQTAGQPDRRCAGRIARVVEFIADPESGYITGQVYPVNGGLCM